MSSDSQFPHVSVRPPSGQPAVHDHREVGVNSTNAAGGEVNRSKYPEPGFERAARGERSAPPT